ncbi:MAG: hypothetical protein U0324_08600 [Polyangiales bacterium]
MSEDRLTPPPLIPSPGKNYEELDGAQGREVFFRPVRYRPTDLGNVRTAVEVLIDGKPHACEMQDVSQNGVAFVWPQAASPPTLGASLSGLAISFDHHEAYRGSATVISVRDAGGEKVVGASFTDALMAIDDVLHLRAVKNWTTEGAPGLAASSRPWHVAGHDRFKSLVGELRLFFEDSDAQLAALEASLPWHVVHGDARTPARAALIDQLQRDFVPEFLRYSEAIDTALRGATGPDWAHLKDFSQRHLHPWMMRAPFLHRCLTKPLGYPGDFEVMRFLYDRQFEGSTLFGKALHLAAVNTRGAQAVRARKDMLKSRLAAQLAHRGHFGPLRVASIAAGPAQEVFELLASLDGPPPPVEFVLFDQDAQALAIAQARLTRYAQRFSTLKIVYLHDSIKRLLQDPTLFLGLGPFDLIFCAGLFDYLKFATAATLCRHFHANLAPGGVAYVGNMVPENPCRWFLEHHLDWYLTYRTRDEMLEFARAAAPGSEISVVEESTGLNPFVTIRKT